MSTLFRQRTLLLGLALVTSSGGWAGQAFDPTLVSKSLFIVKSASVIPTNGAQALIKDPKCTIDVGGQMEVLGESSDHTKIAFRYHAPSSASSSACAQGTLAFIDNAAFFEEMNLLDRFKKQCHQAYEQDVHSVNDVSPQVATLNTDMQKILQNLGQKDSVADLSKPRKNFVADDCDTLTPQLSKGKNPPKQAVTFATQKGIIVAPNYQDPNKLPSLAIPAE